MNPPEPLLCVVDDEPALRQAIGLLARSVQLKVQLFASAEEFLDAFPPQAPAALVLDVRMPGIGGLALLDRLRALGSPLPVIVMTGHGDVAMAVRAMKAGALDFIEKPFQDDALLACVREALAQSARGAPRAAQRTQACERLACLTPRERDVLAGIVQGKLNKQIADRLGLSTRTVELHRARIMNKTGARSASDLVRWSVLAGEDSAA